MIIAHRLKSIKHADVIYVMHQSAVVETGKHEELMKKNGIYQSLMNSQENNQSERKNSNLTNPIDNNPKLTTPDDITTTLSTKENAMSDVSNSDSNKKDSIKIIIDNSDPEEESYATVWEYTKKLIEINRDHHYNLVIGVTASVFRGLLSGASG